MCNIPIDNNQHNRKMKSKWELITEDNPAIINEMTQRLRIPRPVARVLFNRGLVDTDDIRRFLKPSPEQLHDPFLLKDLEEAVDRIIIALREREEIFVFGDYDVDGITAVSMLYLFLKDLGGQVTFYIPDRASEGYGISMSGINEAFQQGCSLIISVDCGVTSVEEVNHANSLGIDVIISDHHEPGEQLPKACAIIDPKRYDCLYPFKDLAGVGVAYKLAQGILSRLGLDDSFIEKYLDLVAIGSAADIVPLVGENRVFVKMGLDKLNNDGLDGIITLIEAAGFQNGRVGVGQIVYGLAPRINAVGRLGSAVPAVELLVTRNHWNAVKIAQVLEEENRRRKEIDAHTLKEALDIIDSQYDPQNDWTIVLAGEDWHSGVIGIVASRIIERYHRPTVMISIENGIGKGSARSIPGFDLHSALNKCSDLLLQFGGHKYAAGLSIEASKIPEFRKRFNLVVKQELNEDSLIPRIHIDDEITLDVISQEMVRTIRMLEPFGPGNSCPLFMTQRIQVSGEPRIVGTNHLRFKVFQNGSTVDAIAFNRAEDIEIAHNGSLIDMVYSVDENVWQDRSNLQLKVRDLRQSR